MGFRHKLTKMSTRSADQLVTGEQFKESFKKDHGDNFEWFEIELSQKEPVYPSVEDVNSNSGGGERQNK